MGCACVCVGGGGGEGGVMGLGCSIVVQCST